MRQIALNRALSVGMKQQQAEALADAVLTALVLRDNNQDPARKPGEAPS